MAPRVQHILAGDIGGTKTSLALYAVGSRGGPSLVRESTFPSARYRGLEQILEEFRAVGRERIRAAAFGIAGPVVDGRVKTTNLPWVVGTTSLERVLSCKRIRLMNDLGATAYGALFLSKKDLRWLARGRRRAANIAVIAAGTGLGQGILFWDGARHRPVGTEGGHTDFAPRTDKELALLVFLQKKYGRVSYERVVSGPGLVNVFRFFDEEIGRPVSPRVRERLKTDDPAAVIGEAGVAGTCPASTEAVETFLGVYGAQAGNLALTVLARGGVFVGGGIAVKMLPKITDGTFMRAFLDKGRYRDFMSEIPVGVMTNPKAALVGARHAALELLP